MSKTDYLEDNLINHVLRGIAFPVPAAIYVALFTTAPGEAGGGVEVSGGSYARQLATFVAPVSGTTSNATSLVYPTATIGWGTVTSFALMDALAGGNILYYANLNAPRIVLVGDQLSFPIGQLQLVED
jgi:hypothetical protein